MKKLLLTISIFLIGILNVEAISLDISGSTSIDAGDTIKVTVNVNGASDFYGLTSALTYDSSKLSYEGASGSNGYSVTVGTSIVIDNSVGKSGNFSVATLTFKAKSSFAIGESTTIKLATADVVDTSGSTASGDSLTIKVAEPKNSNNYLKSLSVSEGSISFSKDKTSYSINVDYDVTSIKISAAAEDSTAKVSGAGTKDLDLYNNTFSIVVTAENGSKKTYKITVNRADEDGNTKVLSSDNTLSSLSIDGYSFVYSSDISEYTILLNSDVTKLNINTSANNEFANVSILEPDNYLEGNNIVTITVLAENGDENKYIINAIKLDNTAEVIVPEVIEESSNTVFYIIIAGLSAIIVFTPITLAILNKKRIITIKRHK